MKGFEDIEKRIARREAGVANAVDKMVKAGADVVAKAQQEEVRALLSGERSTGDLAKSIKPSGVREGAYEKYVEVSPQGKNRRGERNATVGFVQQYGRSNMPARPWMTAANERSAPEVHDAMRAAWEAEQGDR